MFDRPDDLTRQLSYLTGYGLPGYGLLADSASNEHDNVISTVLYQPR